MSACLYDREYNIKCLAVFFLRSVCDGRALWLVAGGDQNILSFRPTQPEKITNIQPSVISPMISWKSPDYLRQARQPGRRGLRVRAPPGCSTDCGGEMSALSTSLNSITTNVLLSVASCLSLSHLSPLHTNTNTVNTVTLQSPHRQILQDDIPY